MGARFTLLLVVVMAAGLSGCFESQRDETFEDTVVLDDVDVRVLNAMADAPELTLDADDEARVEALAFGETDDFSLPANHYRFRVRGDVGGDSLEMLLDGAQDNLEEDKRYDLILTGLLGNASQQVVLFREDDETFEGETQEDRDAEEEEDEENGGGDSKEEKPLEQVRLRAAHLTEGVGSVDLYLDGEPGQALDGDREPDTTLDYGSRSEPLLVEEDVYRLRLTEAGNQQNVIYDSGGRLDFEIDDDLLLAAVPNTGIDNTNRPVSLIVMDGQETRMFPHNEQQGGLQFLHAAAGEDAVEVFVDGNSTWNGVSFAGAEPGSGALDYSLVDNGNYGVVIEDSANAEIVDDNLRVARGRATSAILVEDADDASLRELVVLNNDDRAVVTNARVRMVHAANALKGKIDLYLVEAGKSPGEDGVVEAPLVSGLDYLGRSGTLPVPESTSHELVVTPAGTPGTLLLRASVNLKKGGNYRLVVAGDDNTEAMRLITLGGVR